MRTLRDRLRHAALFEALGVTLSTPLASYIFDQPPSHIGVVAVYATTVATIWNIIYNSIFDWGMLRLLGRLEKTIRDRIIHTGGFELGVILLTMPFFAWYLQIPIFDAFMMNVVFVIFYLIYNFIFNIAYDRIFPVSRPACI